MVCASRTFGVGWIAHEDQQDMAVLSFGVRLTQTNLNDITLRLHQKIDARTKLQLTPVITTVFNFLCTKTRLTHFPSDPRRRPGSRTRRVSGWVRSDANMFKEKGLWEMTRMYILRDLGL
jgi:hypothetical protein